MKQKFNPPEGYRHLNRREIVRDGDLYGYHVFNGVPSAIPVCGIGCIRIGRKLADSAKSFGRGFTGFVFRRIAKKAGGKRK